MPLTQDDIRNHYEQQWKSKSDAAQDNSHLSYSSPIEDAVLYPIYEQLIRDLNIPVNGGRVLDIGSGSGRWIRFFLERFKPAELVGIDYTQASVDLLQKWCGEAHAAKLRFLLADITNPKLDVESVHQGKSFDLINIANVLFHIPEQEKFAAALHNLAKLVGERGRIITTEYLPRTTVRTNWMLVRSRYEFAAAVQAAGLAIADVRATTFFANDPMGLDGPDQGVRGRFHKVRSGINGIMGSQLDQKNREFFTRLFADIEQAMLSYCSERIAQMDLPSQKLVVLKRQ